MLGLRAAPHRSGKLRRASRSSRRSQRTPVTLEDRIRERACHIWEASGRPSGRDGEFWERASEMIATVSDDAEFRSAAAPNKQGARGSVAAYVLPPHVTAGSDRAYWSHPADEGAIQANTHDRWTISPAHGKCAQGVASSWHSGRGTVGRIRSRAFIEPETDAIQVLGRQRHCKHLHGHCHVNFEWAARSRGWSCRSNQAVCRAEVTCCQVLKASDRIAR